MVRIARLLPHFALGLVLTGWMLAPLQASISEPDHLLYGQVTWFGEPVAGGELTLHVPAWNSGPIARYTLGEDPSLGAYYALRVPMNSTGARVPGTARQGDEALVFLGGELLAQLTIGERGTARRMDLDPDSLEGLVALSINDIDVAEGPAGVTTQAIFTVSLSQPIEDPAGFSWATVDGSGSSGAIGGNVCIPGVDFIQDFGSGTITPGNTQTTVNVTVCGNDDPDGDRIFFVQLSDPTAGVGLLRPLGEATIRDNDTLPIANILDVTVPEPPVGETGLAVFQVNLTSAWDQAVTIDWSTANGSALAGVDYVAASGTVSFAPGQQSRQIPITVLSNPTVQDNRDFFVNLNTASQATIGRAQARALIVDGVQTLVHVETQKDGVTVEGMSDPSSIAVASPDGAQVYVASRTADELVVFNRDPETGRLNWSETIDTGGFLADSGRAIDGINGFADLALSANGQHVYAISQLDDAVVTFQRELDSGAPDFGRLSVVQVLFDGDQPDPSSAPAIAGLIAPRGVAVAPDGGNVYIASAGTPGHVLAFSRDAVSGQLLFRQRLSRGANDPLGNQVRGIANPSAITVSADNLRLYVAGQSDDAVAVFNRNLNDNGRLSFRIHYVNGIGSVSGMLAPSALSLAPNDQHLYVTGRDSNAVAVFRRQSNGNLEWLEALTAGSGGVQGLEEPLRVRVSPDGHLVYVVSASDGTEVEPGTLAVLRRNVDSGAAQFGRLSFEELKRNNTAGVSGLWGASGVAVSPDNAHIYVAARFDRAVSVFARDLTPPVNPGLQSTSHLVETWNAQPVIDMQWSGAQDLDPTGMNPGSGLAGYSILFSRSNQSVPNALIDVPQTVDPHGASSAALADGTDHWFHLRSCDNAGNCASTVSAGPYWIDATPPEGPFILASSTHVPGAPAIPDNLISVSWSSAIDAGDAPSGLAGYSYVFNQSPNVGPNQVIDLAADATAISSGAVGDGQWWFHIRAIDMAGNASQPQTIGPFAVGLDQDAPGVFALSAVAAPDGAAVLPFQTLVNATTQLLVRFDKPMAASGPGSAGALNNFRLLEGHLTSEEVSCDQPDGGLLAGADYLGSARLTRLAVQSVTGLAAGDYTFVACDRLEDFNGNGLDGDGSGNPGGNYVLPFSVAWTNLAPNPNFDLALGSANWAVDSALIVRDPDTDAGAAASSGSIRIQVVENDPAAYGVTRCINIDPASQAGFAMQARVRIEDPIGNPDPSKATTSMTFFSEPNCTSSLQGFVSNSVENDTAGAWLPMSASISPGAVAGAASALISLNLEFPAGSAFPLEAWFDNAHFYSFGAGEQPAEPPQIVKVGSSHQSEYADLRQGFPTEASVSQIIPEFSRGVFASPGGTDPAAVNNVNNYRLFDRNAAGPMDCTVASGIALGAISYDAARKQAVVRVASNRALPEGSYRFVVCGSIRDFDDNQLDGAGNGQPGSNYVLDFEVAGTNLLTNPNFDSTLGGWSTEFDPDAGELRWSGADRDGLLSSGAVRVLHQTGPGAVYELSQCVSLSGLLNDFSLQGKVLTNQGFGPAPRVQAQADFHPGSGCTGDALGQMMVEQPFPSSAGSWQPIGVRQNQLPVGSVSARVVWRVTAGDGEDAPFDIWLDTLSLRSGFADRIFRNRFTSEIY